ncbi:SDR family NAD(P)-dependent oxidoreductase [Salipiger sp.]|uniref:SDR family NAD(P)-dependent oxidoreductase n=1 Tax=Salipiger sp. TaxID=2078585 RepID=UPI003A982D3D
MDKKVAIVTGGGSGIGQAISERLIRNGMHVVIADINQANIDATLAKFNADGENATGYRLDITQRDAVLAFAASVNEKFGHIDVLINNAGITRYTPFYEADDSAWDPVVNLDLKAVFYCSQAVARYMVAQKGGKIVNISSSLGTGTSPHHTAGSPGGSAAYASAKAGVIQLTKTLARELGPDNINVNCIAPGFFLTPMTGATRSPEQVADHIRARTEMAVLKRPGNLKELAGVVSFLCSEDSDFVTGHTIHVDGGRSDRM